MARAALLERLRRAPVTWRLATIRDITVESARSRTLSLDVPNWPGHRAGQHVDIRLTAEDGYQTERSYSIASAPELDTLELTVELVDDGEVSPWFVDVSEPGDQFELRGPIGGDFTWSADEGGPLLLVAGGSGLVPIMAMLRHRAARGSDAETHVLISVRAPEERLYTHELALLADSPGLSVSWTYTRSAPESWGDVYRRRVDAAMLAEVGPPVASAPTAFVCGPTPFVEAVTGLLVDAGHAPRKIHAERFGPTGP